MSASAEEHPGTASWTPDGERILAGIGRVLGDSVSNVKMAYVDPMTGEIDQSPRPGASPKLQP